MSDRKTCTETIKVHPHCQSSLSSSSSLCHVPGLFYMSNQYFNHKIPKHLAWPRIQIIPQLLTNNIGTCLPAFCEHGKYIQRQNIGKFSFGISTQTKHFNLFSSLLPVLPINRVSQEECARLLQSVPYVKVYRYNPKHIYPKLNGYGDNGQRKVGAFCGSKYCNLHS